MPPRCFYVYYFTLSLGCIGAFSLWAAPPHRRSAHQDRAPRKPCASIVIDARRIASAQTRASLFLSDTYGTILYAHTDKIFTTGSPGVRRAHSLRGASRLPSPPNLSGRVTVHPLSWDRANGYILGPADAALIAELQNKGLIGGEEQILVLTNDHAPSPALASRRI